MVIPDSPRDLGLPQDHWRPVQVYALDALMERQEAILMMSAPPGTGKSLLAAAWAALQGQDLLYTCVTHDLQAQWCRSFPGLAAEVKGRDNYPTSRFPEAFAPGRPGHVSCADCDRKAATDKNGEKVYKCSLCADPKACPYRVAKGAALQAPHAVLNLAYYIREVQAARSSFSVAEVERQAHCWDCGTPLRSAAIPACAACRWLRCPVCGACGDGCPGGPVYRERLVVVDEADQLPAVIEGALTVSLDPRQISALGLPELRYQTANAEHQRQEWLPWLGLAIERLGEAAERLRQERPTTVTGRARARRRIRALTERADALARVQSDLAANPDSWVRGGGPAEWRPLSAAPHARHMVFRHARRWLLMSGSYLGRELECAQLGLDPAQVGWVDVPHTFPVANRRVYYWPAASMTYRNKESAWPEVTRAMDMILDAYPERALVHTHSYELQRYVLAHSRHATRLLGYTRAAERDSYLAAFKLLPGAVLVAPSLTRGISLDNDLCRCICVLKMAAPSLGDPQVATRLHTPDGWLWYKGEIMRDLIQAIGRGTRSETDWCDSWILDAEFARVWALQHLLPSWFVEGVVTDTKLASHRLQGLLRRAQ